MSQAREKTLPARSTLFRRTTNGIPEVEEKQTEAVSEKAKKRQRIKATFYLESEDVLAIDHLQSEAFRESGKKPERSELVSRAIQAYAAIQNNEKSR